MMEVKRLVLFFVILLFLSTSGKSQNKRSNKDISLDSLQSSLTESQKKLDWHILKLITNYEREKKKGNLQTPESIIERYSSTLMQFDNHGELFCSISKSPHASIVKFIESIADIEGVKIVSNKAQFGFINVFCTLEAFNKLCEVKTIQEIMPIPKSITSATSEGDIILDADLVRAMGITGEGVKIGVISDGVSPNHVEISTNDQLDAAEFELPLIVSNEGKLDSLGPQLFVFNNNELDNKAEGTAMLEIIHDLAPNADLIFCQAWHNNAFLSGAINALNTLGCDIIVDDIKHPYQSFYQLDVAFNADIANAISTFVSNNGIYCTSVGNYQNSWITQDFNLDSNQTHLFSPGDTTLNFSNVPDDNTLTIALQYNNSWGQLTERIRIELWQNASPNDIEVENDLVSQTTAAPFTYITYKNESGSSQNYYLKIKHLTSSNSTTNFRMVIFDGKQFLDTSEESLLTPNGSTFGHPLLTDVIAVGTSHHSNLDQITNYSSHGPLIMYDASGNPLSNIYKPDLTAVDGVQVSGAFGFPPSSPGVFGGTSAAVPHVAAIAGLIKSYQPQLDGSQVRKVMEITAEQFGSYAYNISNGDYSSSLRSNEAGYGRVNALNAFPHCEETNSDLTASSGSLTDGSDIEGCDLKYLPNLNCNWSINISTVESIILTFTAFDLAIGDTLKLSHTDTNNVLQIIDLVGSEIPQSITITSDILNVNFVTNGDLNKGLGWKFDYTSTPCNLELVTIEPFCNGNQPDFYIDLEFTGTGTSYDIFTANHSVQNVLPGQYQIGPFTSGSNISVFITDNNSFCSIIQTDLTETCNDCSGSFYLSTQAQVNSFTNCNNSSLKIKRQFCQSSIAF